VRIDRNDKRFFDFMCSCGDENMERCEKVYEEVRNSFKYREGENPDKMFTTLVVQYLNMMDNGAAYITGITTDQWSAVMVEYESFTDEEPGNEHFVVECDQIHHGLARACQLVEEFDQSVTKP
jgi:hypothetical protein